ncbi:MAG: hypothetical protein DRI40_05105 [Chloroflexi bacterium]|nr:MAG: hypothetical protein DRI40_05105 [Chloroflexota bacterium]
MSTTLSEVYSDPAVREFGATLRRALRIKEIQDYASLIEMENAEKPEDFSEAVRRFLRRFDSPARRLKLRRPTEQSLERLSWLVDQHGVQIVRAALISHALVRGVREDEAEEEEETNDQQS